MMPVRSETIPGRAPEQGGGASPVRIVVSEFMSLDGVVQAPGGPQEDTDGGFAHGGWPHPFFDPHVGAGAGDGRAVLADGGALAGGGRDQRQL